MRKTGIAKRLVVYITAAAVVLGSGFAGAGFSSEAAAYIQYDNIIIRDAANGNILGGIAKGTEVEIVESATGTDGKQWNHVKYAANGTTREGWVRADLMTEDKSKIEPDEEETQEPQQPATPDTTEPTTTDTPDEEEDENVTSELEVVIPDQSVSGEGYEASGDSSFIVCGTELTISGDFADAKIPSGFEKADISYNDGTVKGLKYKHGDVSLVYLKGQGQDGEFYVLDADNQKVHSFIKISAGDNELILLAPPADLVVASSYGKTLYATDEDTAVTAYQFAQQEELADIGTNPAEYFYVYGITESGLPDWYLVDDGEGTFIRATADLTVELDALSGTQIVVQESGSDNSLEKMIIVVMAAIILICIVLIIIFGVRCRRARKGLYEEEEEYEEEDDMGFIQRRREERKYRRFMENFEEEGDEDVSDLLPKKKVDDYLKQTDEEITLEEPVSEEPVLEETVPEEQVNTAPRDTMVLPPVDTVVLKEIMAEQEAEANRLAEQEREAEAKRLAELEKEAEAKRAAEEAAAALAAQRELEAAVQREMSLDDYDIPVSDNDDYDLTDDNSEADKREFDEIENILLAGLSEIEKENNRNKTETQEEVVEEKEAPAPKKEKQNVPDDDEWKDLEFLDI